MKKYKNPDLTPQERAEDIVSLMTVDEKAAQLRHDSQAVERLGLPAYNWWNETLHGVARAGTATMFPQAIALAAMFDPELLFNVARACALEIRAKYNVSRKQGDRDIYKGLTMWTPNINIFRDPRWGRGQETYGECPYLTSRLGVAFVKGLQGAGKYLTAAACAKHYAGHSGPEATRHRFNARISEKDLNETYLPAFEALVREARVEGVMGAYNRLNGEPACASRYLMGKLAEWGFDGYFVSDCWAIRDFYMHHMVTATAPESAAMALKAGCDCNCGNTYLQLLVALKEGLIAEEDITRSAVHVMRTRARLGMLDDSCEYDSIGYEVVSCPTHKALALECAQKSMVLLKNNGLLPLDRTAIKSVGVIGPNAASIEALRGNYYGTADEYITFLDGIRAAFDGRVYYSEGCHLFREHLQPLSQPGDGYSEAVAVAEHSDVVVLCVGLDATIEGEEGDTGNAFASGDKPDLNLPASQRKLIEKVLAVGKPTVIVMACGSSVNPGAAAADAIIQAWYPGQMGGKALADILFGKVSPSGKLPVTFYETAELLPPFDDYAMENRTYRYAKNNVLYPFGYGLTYSRVACRNLSYNPANGTVSFTVENTGHYDTDEVLQLYIRDNESKWAVPNHKLCGFRRIHLRKGEKISVIIALPSDAFEVVDGDGRRLVDSHSFTLYAGVSQPDALSCSLTGCECIMAEIRL
jgi:beta-glucosidase